MALTHSQIAMRAAKELRPGDVVNLGDGLPALVAHFAPSGVELVTDPDIGQVGQASVAILEAAQVSEAGDMAAAVGAGKGLPGGGSLMNRGGLAERIVVVMDHVAEDGSPRLVTHCTLAVVGRRMVQRIITDLATIDVTADGLFLREVAPGVSARQVQDVTQPTLKVLPSLSTMELVSRGA